METTRGLANVRQWTLLRIGACLLAGLIGGVVGAVLALIAGATYGGNYATDFEFAGLRGYEATGFLAAIVTFPIAGAFCVLAVRHLTSRWSGPA